MSISARHVVISGRVQGVGYRDWTVQAARALGLTGWVRNRRDGAVEALFQGDADAVERMIAACREGPRLARVTRIDIEPADDAAISASFERRPTG